MWMKLTLIRTLQGNVADDHIFESRPKKPTKPIIFKDLFVQREREEEERSMQADLGPGTLL